MRSRSTPVSRVSLPPSAIGLPRLQPALHGRVVAVRGGVLVASLPDPTIGAVFRVEGSGLLAEVVGFEGAHCSLLPFGPLTGVAPGQSLTRAPMAESAPDAPSALGRVIDALGRDLESGEQIPLSSRPLRAAPPSPLTRRSISRQLRTGVRAIDALLPLGEGQRVGIFAGAGVGKSSLLARLASGIDADVVVLALVGERGREVGEFLRYHVPPELRARTTVVVATGDAPPMLRRRATECATALAEAWRDAGRHALLLVDSLTRHCRALREAALLAGETPVRRGYPASVFAELPRLLERTGQAAQGAITALYTVLLEGSDMEEPIADEVRGIVDGHWVLSRTLVEAGHHPALCIPQSLSRVESAIVAPDVATSARTLRQLIDLRERTRDACELGLYTRGSDPRVDAAIDVWPEVEAFLQQRPEEFEALDATHAELHALAAALP